MHKNDIKIGFAPTRRYVFSKEDALKYKGLVLDKIKSFDLQIIGIDDTTEDGFLVTEADIIKVINKFKSANVDCIFAPHCNFGTEFAVAKLANEIKKPILIWGPRDELPLEDGTRLRDTQCGLFATSKILQRFNLPFSYILNSRLDEEIFEKGFKNFIRAANVVKEFKKIRIGQIGVRPRDFWTVICNEGELLQKFNIEVVPFNLFDVVSDAKKLLKNNSNHFNDIIKEIKSNVCFSFDEESLRKIIALKETIKELSIGNSLSAVCIQCWTSLQEMFGIVPCFVNGLLTDEGTPTVCETDINGAVSAVMAKSALLGETSPFFADLTIRHPLDNNGELLWHCGPFPPSLKKDKNKVNLLNHWILESHCPGIADFELKGGDISIVRFESDNGKYFLFAGHAKGMEGPKTTGTYVWIKVNNWAMWEDRFINGPYIHHVAGIHGKIVPILYEALKYIKDLNLDLIDPTETEIKGWLYKE